jgi:hypothetical protein
VTAEAPDVVPGWSRGGFTTSQLTLTTTAPLAEALTLLEAGLREASFKVKARTPTSLRARYVNWVDVAAGSLNRTRLAARAVTSAEGTVLVISGSSFQGGASGRARAGRALSIAVEAMRVHGHEVSTTEWRVAPRT